MHHQLSAGGRQSWRARCIAAPREQACFPVAVATTERQRGRVARCLPRPHGSGAPAPRRRAQPRGRVHTERVAELLPRAAAARRPRSPPRRPSGGPSGGVRAPAPPQRQVRAAARTLGGAVTLGLASRSAAPHGYCRGVYPPSLTIIVVLKAIGNAPDPMTTPWSCVLRATKTSRLSVHAGDLVTTPWRSCLLFLGFPPKLTGSHTTSPFVSFSQPRRRFPSLRARCRARGRRRCSRG